MSCGRNFRTLKDSGFSLLMISMLFLISAPAKAGSGSDGVDPCEPPNVSVRGTMNVTNNTGQDANDMHFYMYQNDQPSVHVVGASVSCPAFGNVDVGLDSGDNRHVPPGQGEPYHGASADLSGGTVPAGATVQVEVELCMNEKNCLKIKGPEWTSDGAPLPQQPPGGRVNGGWRVGQPFPGGNGGSPQDPGGGGRGAQEGFGGGDGNHVHMICIENDDDTLCMLLRELKVLASQINYPDINAIDWSRVDPVKNDKGEPPVVIQPRGSWCFPFETAGSYLNGHVYLRMITFMVPCGKSAKEGGEEGEPIVVGDHPNPDMSEDADLDTLWDAWEYSYGLDPTDDGTTDPKNGPFGDPDGDGVTNAKEQQLLTHPIDAASPPTIKSGYDLLRTVEPMVWTFGEGALPSLPAGFFGPGSDPFTGTIALHGLPLGQSPICPGDLGATDTIIRRSTVAAFPGVPSSDMVQTEIVALSLKTVEPIRVTSGGGMVESFFDVFMTIDPGIPVPGGMNINKNHGNGGDCMLNVALIPLFVFTEVGNPSNQFERFGPEFGAMDILGATNVPWQQLMPEARLPECCSEFVPGADRGIVLPFTLLGNHVSHSLQAAYADTAPGASDVLAGHDLLMSLAGTECTFGFGLPPIPADFFGPGSDPFEGQVSLEGQPLPGGTPCSGDLGGTSIILKRGGPAVLPEPSLADTIPIEIVALSLRSVSPIQVDLPPPESFFDVFVSISNRIPSAGSMQITRNNALGGTCGLDLWLYPKFTFVQVGNPSIIKEFDGPAYGFVLHLRAEDVPWINESKGLGWPASCASNFAEGVLPYVKNIAGVSVPFSLEGTGASFSFQPSDMSGDSDGDGLTDFEEGSLGTNPDNPDTDGDELPDGWEHDNGLNPLVSSGENGASGDPDGDGLTNLVEYQTTGTDPGNPDTDGDGLPDGWEHQYGLSPLNNTGNDGANGDPDNDGYTNIEEYQIGSDPMDPNDPPQIPIHAFPAALTLAILGLLLLRRKQRS